jgi:transcriptional regulator with PAS, ATPase and Fis domain
MLDAAAPTFGKDDTLLESYESAPEMKEMMERVWRVVGRDTTLLLSGETGTGKTRLARLIHQLSPRKAEPFLVVDCGALSANLIESEMFGHVRGAFTGADRDRQGKFAAVGAGTLLLDEINALPLGLQSKLLRAVDERVFEPVGLNKALPLRARIIAVSNTRLDEDVRAGRFRADLYYRLNVIGFDLPPLRDRPSAIPPLVLRFLREFSEKTGQDVMGISADAVDLLSTYSWPGNIRELRNVVERAVILCSAGEIQADDLPEAIRIRSRVAWDEARDPDSDAPAPRLLFQAKQNAEVARIAEALEKHGNNRRRTAAELGISRMALYKKLHKYGLATPAAVAMPAV